MNGIALITSITDHLAHKLLENGTLATSKMLLVLYLAISSHRPLAV